MHPRDYRDPRIPPAGGAALPFAAQSAAGPGAMVPRLLPGGERRLATRIGLSYFLLLLVSTAIQFLITFFIQLLAPEVLSTSWYLYALSAFSLYLCGMPLTYLLLRKVPRFSPTSIKLGARGFWLCLLMCMGIMSVGNLLGQLVNWLLGTLMQTSATNPVETILGGTDLALTAVYVVILAPVMEEILFRKWLCDRLLHWGQGPAALISGLFFGLFHGNFYQFFYAFGLGVIFGYVYIRTGRLRYTIILHVIINLIGTASAPLLNWLLEVGGFAGNIAAISSVSSLLALCGILGLILLYLGACIAGIVLLIVLRKRFLPAPHPALPPRSARASVLILNVGTILFIVLSLLMFLMNLLLL